MIVASPRPGWLGHFESKFLRDARGETGLIQAVGPPTLPTCPTLLNPQTAFCQGELRRQGRGVDGRGVPPASASHRARSRARCRSSPPRRSEDTSGLIPGRDRWPRTISSGGPCFVFLDGRLEVLIEGEPATAVGVEDDPLKVDVGRATGIGELAIKGADRGQGLVGPVAPVVPMENRRPSGRSTAWLAIIFPASRYFDRNAGDIARAFPALVNPSPAAPSTGSPAGPEVNAGQIEDGVGVLGVVQPSENNGPRASLRRQGPRRRGSGRPSPVDFPSRRGTSGERPWVASRRRRASRRL